MRLREKIKADFGLWQLHLGLRKPPNYKSDEEILLETKETKSKSIRNSRDPECGVFRRMVTEILKKHGTHNNALKVFHIIKNYYDYQGHYDIRKIANTLSVARYDILNDITDEKIIELYKNNSTREIARMLGMCNVSIQDRLMQNGVKLRSRSESKILYDKKKRDYNS